MSKASTYYVSIEGIPEEYEVRVRGSYKDAANYHLQSLSPRRSDQLYEGSRAVNVREAVTGKTRTFTVRAAVLVRWEVESCD